MRRTLLAAALVLALAVASLGCFQTDWFATSEGDCPPPGVWKADCELTFDDTKSPILGCGTCT